MYARITPGDPEAGTAPSVARIFKRTMMVEIEPGVVVSRLTPEVAREHGLLPVVRRSVPHGEAVGFEIRLDRVVECVSRRASMDADGLKDVADAERKRREEGPVDLDGRIVRLSTAGQVKIAESAQTARESDQATFTFQAEDGWYTISAAEMVALNAMVRAHVQATFTAARTISDAIEAGSLCTEDAVRNHPAWPPIVDAS